MCNVSCSKLYLRALLFALLLVLPSASRSEAVEMYQNSAGLGGCDGLDLYIREDLPVTYKKKDPAEMRRAWDAYISEYPGCSMTADEYYGVGGKPINRQAGERKQSEPIPKKGAAYEAWTKKCFDVYDGHQALQREFPRYVDWYRYCREKFDPNNMKTATNEIMKKAGANSADMKRPSSPKKKSTQNDGIDIDVRTQRPCVQLLPVSPFPQKYKTYFGDVLQYNYKVTNTCPRRYSIFITTNAGATSSLDVGANKSTAWFCTDGHRNAKDCRGGVATYTFK
jgi:hypothetical protein